MKLKEEVRKIKCAKCGKMMKRVAPYAYECPCNPEARLLIA